MDFSEKKKEKIGSPDIEQGVQKTDGRPLANTLQQNKMTTLFVVHSNWHYKTGTEDFACKTENIGTCLTCI